MSVIGKIGIYKLLGIVNLPYCDNGVEPKMGADQQRLKIRITDAADADVPGKVRQILFKPCTKRSIGNRVDLPGTAAVLIQNGNTCASGSKVTMVIRTKENIQYNIAV